MSDFARLIQDLPQSPALQAKLGKVDGLDAAVLAAKEAGYAITSEEVSGYINALQSETRQELSDDQLDAVAGGKGLTQNPIPPFLMPGVKPGIAIIPKPIEKL